jgi:glycosyltransferase involved in cell wall biosynthesis
VKKLRVLFVAGLTPMAGGEAGGQLSAATALYESDLAKVVELLPLSSTMASVPPPPAWVRAAGALGRLVRFVWSLPRTDVALIFTSDGLGFLEKGVMCILARFFGRGVVIRFGSGRLPDQCEIHPWFKRWLRRVLRSAHAVSVQGAFWVRYFGQYPEAVGKVVEIPNGLALPSEAPAAGREKGRITFVGWMQREKGIFEALEGVRRVRETNPEATFTLVGGGGDLERFRFEVREKGMEAWVNATGWVERSRIPALLARSSVFLLPSHFEGLPNAMLEAMASGLPVVVTRVGSIPDVVRDGESGFLVDVGDVDGISRALQTLLTDSARAQQMGRRAREDVVAHCDIERVWPRYADALRRAAAAAGRLVDSGLAADGAATSPGDRSG